MARVVCKLCGGRADEGSRTIAETLTPRRAAPPCLPLALSLASASPRPAAGRGRRAAFRGTIQSQIDAFLADDFARAFGYAAPSIQDVFRTPENFGAMVRNGYPMVWRPAAVEFLELHPRDGGLWQKVRIRDAEGRVHVLDYQMVDHPRRPAHRRGRDAAPAGGGGVRSVPAD